MSGNTGKLTRAAIRERGPRMVLARVSSATSKTDRRLALRGIVIYREGTAPFGEGCYHGIVAKSYTLSYLAKIGRTMR